RRNLNHEDSKTRRRARSMEMRRRGKLIQELHSLLGASDCVEDFLAMNRHFSWGFDTQSDFCRVNLDLDHGTDNFIAEVERPIFFEPAGEDLFGHRAAGAGAGDAEIRAGAADLEHLQLRVIADQERLVGLAGDDEHGAPISNNAIWGLLNWRLANRRDRSPRRRANRSRR